MAGPCLSLLLAVSAVRHTDYHCAEDILPARVGYRWRLYAGDYETAETAPTADEATGVILRALSLGISFLNTSDLYGPFQNERRIGVPLAAWPRPACDPAHPYQ